MIFDLVKDYADVLDAIPAEHPRRRILKLLDEAIRRDVHFIDRHPTTFFQCMWNTCWWYDCPEAVEHYVVPEGGWCAAEPARQRSKWTMYTIMERWRDEKERCIPGFHWVRAMHPLPIALGSSLQSVLRGHTDWIGCLAFSADGRHLATGSNDRSVRIWDVASGEEIACLVGHSDDVIDVEFARDGRSLITVCRVERRTWNLDDYHCSTIEGVSELNEFKTHLSCRSSDGTLVAESLGVEGVVQIRVVDSGETRRCLGRHDDRVNALVFSPDGRLLASGSGENRVLGLPSGDCSVRLWDVSTGAEIHHMSGHLASIDRLVFSPDGRYLVSASADHTARIWVTDHGRPIACLHHSGDVYCLALSPDGRWLATSTGGVSSDNAVRIWDLETVIAAELEFVERHCGQVVAAAADRVVTYHGQGQYSVHNARSGTLCGQFVGTATSFGFSCALSADGRLLALQESWPDNLPVGQGRALSSDGEIIDTCHGAKGGTILVFDVERGQIRTRINGAGDRFTFFADGKRLLSTTMMGGILQVWDVDSGHELSRFERLCNTASVGREIAVSPDGHRIASILHWAECEHHERGNVCLWEADTGQLVRYLGAGHEGEAVAFSGDGLHLATIGAEGICVFEITTGIQSASIPLAVEDGSIESLALSVDGKNVACQQTGYQLGRQRFECNVPSTRVWDVGTGALLRSTTGFVPLAEFVEGGSALIAVDRESETAIVAAHTGETVAVFPAAGVTVKFDDREWGGGGDIYYHYRVRFEGAEIASETKP